MTRSPLETPAEAWARCRPFIEAALGAADPLNTIEYVEERIEADEAQFWAGRHSACVTQVIDYPRRRILNLWLCGGDLRELRQMLPAIEDWARRRGCTAEYLSGRPAWGAVLHKHGFKAGQVTFEKEI